MKIFSIIKTILVLLFLVVGVFFVAHFGGSAKDEVFSLLHIPTSEVKGASTQKAEEITSQVSSDIGKQVDTAKQGVLDVKVSDLLSFFSRFQKVPQDAHNMQEYVQSFIKEKKTK